MPPNVITDDLPKPPPVSQPIRRKLFAVDDADTEPDQDAPSPEPESCGEVDIDPCGNADERRHAHDAVASRPVVAHTGGHQRSHRVAMAMVLAVAVAGVAFSLRRRR